MCRIPLILNLTFCPLALEKYVQDLNTTFKVSNPPSNDEKRGEEEEGRRRRKKKEEEGEEEEEELKAFAMIKKMNQYISTSPGSTTCKTTYNN